ncbi:hypothetical protein ACQPXB_21950 [Amycolatopsis sp. CA-161197]|uniref:hypothetical protein n=1 Tax=Amycolatopsis sp. CA-161197 TaxID=3239922 RepID=UPI003D8F05DB
MLLMNRMIEHQAAAGGGRLVVAADKLGRALGGLLAAFLGVFLVEQQGDLFGDACLQAVIGVGVRVEGAQQFRVLLDLLAQCLQVRHGRRGMISSHIHRIWPGSKMFNGQSRCEVPAATGRANWAMMIESGRGASGVSGYVGDGANRWPSSWRGTR